MTHPLTHPSFETLNDFVDGRLVPDARLDCARHVESCTECAAAIHELRASLAAALALPREVAVPDGLWDDVRASIARKQVVALPVRENSRRGWSFAPRTLIAAAVALVAVSSFTTAVLVRQPPAGQPAAAAVLPASWLASEQGYLESAESLGRLLEAQRGELDPATIAAVERSLATIDAAIGEARSALLGDPANAALTELLASNYRQKVDLLRRATQLAPST